MKELSWEKINPNEIKNNFILLDIDGSIVPDGGQEVADSILQKIVAINKVNKIVFCSNKNNCQKRNQIISSLTQITCLNIPHKKPSRKILNYLENHNGLPLLVIGDKFLTDGFFAKRIGAKFLKVKRLTAADDSLLTRLIYLLDDLCFYISNIFHLCNI